MRSCYCISHLSIVVRVSGGRFNGLFLFHLILPRPACGGPGKRGGKSGGHPRAPGHGTASPGTPCCLNAQAAQPFDDIGQDIDDPFDILGGILLAQGQAQAAV